MLLTNSQARLKWHPTESVANSRPSAQRHPSRSSHQFRHSQSAKTELSHREEKRMKKLLILGVWLVALCVPCSHSQQEAKAIYKDANASIPDRVQDLLGKMTVEEKVAQLESSWVLPPFGNFKVPSPIEGDHVNEAMVKKIAGNGLGTFAFLDEFLGTRESSDPRVGAKNRNLLQAWVLKNTRLGIPIMYHGEALHGAVTMG